jgi:hypothetical protein
MSFKYRTKTYESEEGEYSEYAACDKELIEQIIERNWVGETMPNGLHVISILNEAGQSLMLEHFRKDVFDVYFLPAMPGFHFHKKSKQEIIYVALEYFMSNETSRLEAVLTKKSKDDSYIRKEFFYVDHNYRLTNKRDIGQLMWLVYFGLPWGIMFTLVSSIVILKGPGVAVAFGLLLFAIGTYGWLPGLLLHLSYKKDFQDFVVRLTKGNKSIFIKYKETNKVLLKSDIEVVTKFQNPAFKLPWSDYGFIEVVFRTGEVINLTNLTVDQWSILDKFASDNVETKTLNKAIPKLQKKSMIK